MRILNRNIFMVAILFLSACASLPENNQQTPSYAISASTDTSWARGIESRRERQGIDESKSGMLLLQSGVDAFVARLALARLAERTLDVQYYLYHSDLSGGLLTAELWKAAERGVRVRVLLDDMDMAGKDHDLAILDAHKNIEIRLFNPFTRGKARAGQYVTRFGSVTRRAHNKAMIADNAIGIVGGRNIGDEYFGANANMAFGDLDVALTNPAASEVSQAFDLYWNSALAYPVTTLIKEQATDAELAAVEDRVKKFYESHKDAEYITRLNNSELLKSARNGTTQYHWGKATVLYDQPEKISSDREHTEYHLAPKLVPFISSAQKELLVISPYFVPGKKGVEFFAALKQRGVQVKIVTNSLMSNDVPIVHAGYAKYRKQLLKSGVEIFELDKTALGDSYKRKKNRKTREGISGSKASLHAKYFIVDRESAFIGSLNLDPRSVVENTEIGVVISSQSLASELAVHFDNRIRDIAFVLKLDDGDVSWERYLSDGSVRKFDKEPYSTWWDRFSVGFMKLLPGESQL